MKFTLGIVLFSLSGANIFAVENNTANVGVNATFTDIPHGVTASIPLAAADEKNLISQVPFAFTTAPSRAVKPVGQQAKTGPEARCSNANGPYFVGSVIYWKSKFDVLDTVIETTSGSPIVNVPFVVTVQDPRSEYSLGFKAGMGYNFKRDTWDTFFNWTRLGSHTSKNFNSPNQGLINLMISPTLGGSKVQHSTEVDTKWSTLFNSLDWELAKSFLVGRYLALRPFAGIKVGWLHTTLKINELGLTDGGVVYEKLTNQNWGIGPRLGLNTRWILSESNFGFVANIAGSLLLEKIKNKLSATSTTAPTPVDPVPGATILTVTTKHDILAPVIEVFFGLDWGICYNKDRFYFNMAVGVEGQYWVNQQLYGTLLATNPSNNLNMYGLTGSIRFDF